PATNFFNILPMELGRPRLSLRRRGFHCGFQRNDLAARNGFGPFAFWELKDRFSLKSPHGGNTGDYALPATPLKKTEKRAARWQGHWGHEQTEIDALAALRPEVLRYIATAAILAFYDPDLSRRVEEARPTRRRGPPPVARAFRLCGAAAGDRR